MRKGKVGAFEKSCAQFKHLIENILSNYSDFVSKITGCQFCIGDLSKTKGLNEEWHLNLLQWALTKTRLFKSGICSGLCMGLSRNISQKALSFPFCVAFGERLAFHLISIFPKKLSWSAATLQLWVFIIYHPTNALSSHA